MNKMVVYVLFGIFAFGLFPNTAVSTSWDPEAKEIPFQVNHSDRIVVGTVKSASSSFDYTDVIISVDEWLKNSLPRNEITVRTEWGTNAFTAGAAKFSVGEKVLLMLKDVDTEKGKFSMPFMELGKRSVSDRDEVIKAINEQEKAKAIEIALSDPKVKESLPTDVEVIAVEIPPFAGKNDRIYNVIFKHGEFHDIITVNLTSGNVENSVSIRGEYQPKVEDLPMPVFREDVIVYFKEMPASLEEFASRYGVKLIFVKQDIKLAAFETNPVGRPGEVSKATLDFINEVSKNPLVEEAFHDGFMFTRPDREYSSEPKLTYPEDMRDEYVPNEVIVGFWRFPPSLEEFASKHGGKLKNFDDADNVLKSALFETNNITEFIKKVSTDPYVRYAEPNGIVRIADVLENNTSAAVNTPKAPGFILSGGLISLLGVWLLRRRRIR